MRRRDAGADPSCKRGRRLGPLLGALRGRLAPRCEDCSFGDTRDRRGPGRAPQRLLGGRSGQKRPELQPQGDRRQASRPAAARGGQARGRRLGSRRPVSRPSRTLGTPRGWLSAASQGEPGGLGGRPGLGAALLPRRGGQHSGWLGLGSSPLGAPYDSDTSRQFPSTSHAPDGVGRRWPGLCAGRCGRLSAQPCPCPSLCSPQCPCSSPTIQKETKLSSLGSLGSIEISARRLRTVPDKQRGQRRSPPLPTCRVE